MIVVNIVETIVEVFRIHSSQVSRRGKVLDKGIRSPRSQKLAKTKNEIILSMGSKVQEVRTQRRGGSGTRGTLFYTLQVAGGEPVRGSRVVF